MPAAPSSVKHFILATAGHVDHGKTALVQALTGVDTDRLPEEKARGITIELGFAHLALSGFSLGVIDVPGHEDFVRNMIAGVGAVDLALFVVAADDGWMPQTEEHLQILLYLGVMRAVVALTKSDLRNVGTRREEIRQQLRDTPFAHAPIVETSVRRQTGIAQLKEALTRECEKLPEARDVGKPRLFVDRVFTVRGAGTIVTGTLSGGQFTRGEAVEVQPAKMRARVRGLQSHNQPLEVAQPRTRVALNLADVSPAEIMRGTVVTAADGGGRARAMDVLLERSARLPASSRPLRNGSHLNFYYGGARLSAHLELLDRKELLPNEMAIARLRFAFPVFAFVGDRFILRDASDQLTVAGGSVLDADAAANKFRSAPQRTLLDARAAAPNDIRTLLQTQLRRDQFFLRAGLLQKANFSREEIADGLDALKAEEQIFLEGKIAADAGWWKAVRAAAIKLIEGEHTAHPERAGLEISRLRDGLSLNGADLFDALLGALVNDGYIQTRNLLQRATYHPSLPAELRSAGDRIQAALAAQPFNPPSRKELAPELNSERALRFLVETRAIIEITGDVVLGAEAFTRMRDSVVKFITRNGPAAAGQLREALGSSRRIMMPFLERLDREGVTRRSGDKRILSKLGRG